MFEKIPTIQAAIDKLRKKWIFFNHFCLYYHTLRLNFSEKPPLLVYQMSKVGSLSVYHTLKEVKTNYNIFHIHYLMGSTLRRIKNLHKERSQKIAVHVPISDALIKKIKKQRHSIPWKVITLVRDPIKREISGWFQRAHLFQTEFQDSEGNWSEEKIRHFIEERLCQFDEKTDFCCNWFDKEMKAIFDIDIFDYSFPKEEGYQIIKKSNVKLIIFRLEDLNTTFPKAIKKFLKLDREIQLVTYNVAQDKEYSKIYKSVVKNITIPENISHKIYNSKFVRHFYRDESLKKMAQQWF